MVLASLLRIFLDNSMEGEEEWLSHSFNCHFILMSIPSSFKFAQNGYSQFRRDFPYLPI